MHKEKLDDQIMVHLPRSVAVKVRQLAELHGEDGGGPYVRELILRHLEEKQHQFQRMRDVFGSPENDQ